jgi:GNAT superfamily N-acetyltransferase
MVVDVGRTADVEWVAVLPEARGRGLSGRLLANALADAAERGCEMSTLVATSMGRPTYERLGYRALGALQLWEQRRG